MHNHDEEKLNHLLQRTQPPPVLEPDPRLPARIRAANRSRPRLRVVRTRRWVPVSLAAAALAVAIAIGGYLGYTAGATVAAESEVAVAESGTEVLLSAWSQTGFAEDWQQWERTDGDEER
jgi:hypothetical protein